MTLIMAANSDGVYGRCDAKCHNAGEPHCDCICRPAYHGLGTRTPELQRAVEQHFQTVGIEARGLGSHGVKTYCGLSSAAS